MDSEKKGRKRPPPRESAGGRLALKNAVKRGKGAYDKGKIAKPRRPAEFEGTHSMKVKKSKDREKNNGTE